MTAKLMTAGELCEMRRAVDRSADPGRMRRLLDHIEALELELERAKQEIEVAMEQSDD